MANPNRSGLPMRPMTLNQRAVSLRPGDVVTIGQRRALDTVASVAVEEGQVAYRLSWTKGSFARRDLVLRQRSKSSPATIGDRVSTPSGGAAVVTAVIAQAGRAEAYQIQDGDAVSAVEAFLEEEASPSSLALALQAHKGKT